MIKIDSIDLYKSEKILNIEDAAKLIEKLKAEGKTAGLCHGGFDLMHPGHVKHFESAKKLCDILFVSITSDEFVTLRKGDGRPVYPDKLRAYFASTIRFVDYVVITDFKLGTDVIKIMKPSFYIKGPDFINKTTPGIIAERQTIKDVGGEIKYTNEPPLSTTGIIKYIKTEIKDNKLLLIIDRDGTIIKSNDFLGKNINWRDELIYNEDVVNFILYLQTKFDTTKYIVSNQSGVSRGFFGTETVEKINETIKDELNRRGIKTDSWQYCPDTDTIFVSQHPEYNFIEKYVKEKTKRKPSTDMVLDALNETKKNLNDFNKIIVIGDREEDKGLAINLKASFIDVNNKNYDQLINEVKVLNI